MKKVFILKRDESNGYGSEFCILGVFSRKELADEYLRKFQENPEYGHESCDYWIDPYDLDVLDVV